MPNYQKIEKLGEGSYGKVYSAINEKGERVAIKRLLLNRNVKHKGTLGLKELDVLARCKHPYINSLIEVVTKNPFESKLSTCKGQKNDKAFIVSPLARFNLIDLIYKKSTPISHMKRAMYQILSGLYYLHANGIVHRDIKPGNILCFYENGILTAKLTDFGMSRPIFKQDKNSLHVVTTCYKPPEILCGNRNYTDKIDIWALGCTFFEMITEKDIFHGNTEIDHLISIFKIMGTPTPHTMKKISGEKELPVFRIYKGENLKQYITRDDFETDVMDYLRNPGTKDQFCDLLSHMLCIDPDSRYSALQCLNHPFFSSVSDKDPYQHNIYIQPTIKQEYHILDFPHWHLEGLSIFQSLVDKYDESNVRYSHYQKAIFLGLDIYHRILVSSNIPRCNHDLLAICSSYIAFKYYFDESSPHLQQLFPNTKYSATQIETIEFKILRDCLGFIVYRPSLFDLVRSNSRTLFALLCKCTDIYGYPLDQIAIAYSSHLSSLPY